eukprot:366239-Chlamydomonas_euryale.AAC.15
MHPTCGVCHAAPLGSRPRLLTRGECGRVSVCVPAGQIFRPREPFPTQHQARPLHKLTRRRTSFVQSDSTQPSTDLAPQRQEVERDCIQARGRGPQLLLPENKARRFGVAEHEILVHARIHLEGGNGQHVVRVRSRRSPRLCAAPVRRACAPRLCACGARLNPRCACAPRQNPNPALSGQWVRGASRGPAWCCAVWDAPCCEAATTQLTRDACSDELYACMHACVRGADHVHVLANTRACVCPKGKCTCACKLAWQARMPTKGTACT